MIVTPDVEYVGEINDLEKSAFLSGAVALLVPIAWPEPFGLVHDRGLACGAPVIAYDRGSVREIVEPGVTGFVVENETEAVAAAAKLSRLSRPAIRKRFEARFTARRMAEDYLDVYRGMIEAATPKLEPVRAARSAAPQFRPAGLSPTDRWQRPGPVPPGRDGFPASPARRASFRRRRPPPCWRR